MESFFSSFFLLFFHSDLLLNSFHHSIISSGILAFSILHFKGISLSSSLLPPPFLSASARATGSISFPASDSAVCAFSFFFLLFLLCFCVVPRWLVEFDVVSFRCDGSVHAASTHNYSICLSHIHTHTYTPWNSAHFGSCLRFHA